MNNQSIDMNTLTIDDLDFMYELTLSTEFTDEFKNFINWDIVSSTSVINIEYALKFCDKINYDIAYFNTRASNEAKRYLQLIYLDKLTATNDLTEDIIC